MRERELKKKAINAQKLRPWQGAKIKYQTFRWFGDIGKGKKPKAKERRKRGCKELFPMSISVSEMQRFVHCRTVREVLRK